MWLTRRFPGTFGIGLSAATVTVSLRGAPCVFPAVAAVARIGALDSRRLLSPRH